MAATIVPHTETITESLSDTEPDPEVLEFVDHVISRTLENVRCGRPLTFGARSRPYPVKRLERQIDEPKPKTVEEPKIRQLPSEFAETLMQALQDAGMKQIDLARRLGVKHSTVSGWIRHVREPWSGHVAALAEIFPTIRALIEVDSDAS